MEQNEEMDMLKVDVGRAAVSCNANLVVVFNQKKMMFYYENLQKAADLYPDKAMPLFVFLDIVNKQGEPCKKKNTGYSFAFVARGISMDEALDEY